MPDANLLLLLMVVTAALAFDYINQGHDLKRFYQDLVGYARHLLLAGLYPEARNLAPVADTEWEELTRLARQSPAIHLHNVLRVLLEGEEELKRAPQPRLALEVLLLRLIHLEPPHPRGRLAEPPGGHGEGGGRGA